MSPASERSFRIWLPLPEICTRILGGLWTRARPGGSWRLSVTSKLVVTGCCSCTATYSISARNSAAPLIGQLRVIPWNTLGLAQQTSDQHLVDRVFPVCRADDALHDHALAIDDITLRHAENIIRLPDRPAGIVQDVERQAEVIRKRHDFLGARLFLVVEGVAVHAHRRNAEIGPGEPLMQTLHGRHFGPARRAPGRPNVHQHHLATIV